MAKFTPKIAKSRNCGGMHWWVPKASRTILTKIWLEGDVWNGQIYVTETSSFPKAISANITGRGPRCGEIINFVGAP